MKNSVQRFTGYCSARVGLSGAVAIVLLAVPGFRILQAWGCLFARPIVLDYGPAQFALRVHLLVQGLPLYRDFRAPPYLPWVYGPVVPWIAAAISGFFGSGVMAALEAGRFVTLFSTLVVCILIFLLARRSGAGALSALLVVLGFVITPLVQRWGFAFRVDMPDLACELLGLFLYSCGMVFPAVGVMVLGFFVKQGRVAAIAAVVLCAWLGGKRRQAVTMAAAWAIGVAVVIAILQWTHPWYWLNAFDAIAVMHYDFRAPALFLALTLVECAGLVYLAVSGLVVGRSRDLLSLCFLGAAIVQDSFSCLKWGSSIYYFLPTLAALAIVGAKELDALLKLIEQRGLALRGVLGATTAAVLAVGFLALPQTRITALRESSPPLLAGRLWSGAAMKRLRAISGPVYTDTASLMLVDRSPQLQFIGLMALRTMNARGAFDDGALIAAIRDHRIAAFALNKQLLGRDWRGRKFFWPRLRRAIEENYALASSKGPPFLMVPRVAALSPVAKR